MLFIAFFFSSSSIWFVHSFGFGRFLRAPITFDTRIRESSLPGHRHSFLPSFVSSTFVIYHVRNYTIKPRQKPHKYNLYHRRNNSQSCFWLNQIFQCRKKEERANCAHIRQEGWIANFYSTKSVVWCTRFHCPSSRVKHQFFIDVDVFFYVIRIICAPV